MRNFELFWFHDWSACKCACFCRIRGVGPITREKAVSCQITFKLYSFFSQFVANSSKASLSCYIYCDLRQLMVILRIVYVIYCHFAIFCDIYCDLWQFCNNFKFFSWFCNSLWYLLQFMAILQQFQVFVMILLFYRFFPSDMGPHCGQKKKLFFPPCFKHPPPSRTGRKDVFFQYFLMWRIIWSTQNQ